MKRSPDGAIRRGFLLNRDSSADTTNQLLVSNQGLPMNTLERRQLVKARVIDVKVAKASVNESRRQRAEAAKALRKDLAATRYASAQRETVSLRAAS